MATTLTDKTLSKVLSQQKQKGFRTKFWREYRASAAKGQGVGKHLDGLEKLGMGPGGELTKVDLDDMGQVVQLLGGLANAFLKAEGKCGMLQSHTKEFCKSYRDLTRKITDTAEKMARDADKIKLARAQQAMKKEAELQATEKELEKFNKQRDDQRALYARELSEIEARAGKILKAAEQVSTETGRANDEIEKLLRVFRDQHGKGNVDPQELESKVDGALRTLAKTFNLDMHAKNVGKSFPKLIKETGEAFKQFNAVEGIKKERMRAAKAVQAAQNAFKQAQDDIKFTLVSHKRVLETVATARKEGV